MANNNNKEVVLPSVSFSLAAIVRRQESQNQPQKYAIVHERPPRGWWLPGGGVEHHDETPVDAAIREAVEEAGSPSLLPLLPLSQSSTKDEVPELRLLPSMTHLISLEQRSGRIRFIFRGEWIDDCVDIDNSDNQTAASKEPTSILKCPPGDDDSIEAKWITWDEVQCLEEIKRIEKNKTLLLQSMNDFWLRGHEPITFFGMLECSWLENGSVPGLPVHTMNFRNEHDNDHQEEEVTGAFFGRMHSDNKSKKATGLTFNGRAVLLTHLKCRLLLYNKIQRTFAIDTATKTFPSSLVKDQNEMTLKQLVDGMIADVVALPSEDNSKNEERNQTGLLRVEHVIHANGREATLTVFPFVCLCATDGMYLGESTNHETMIWVAGEELSENLERKLAGVVIADQSRKQYLHLDILRDDEGPK